MGRRSNRESARRAAALQQQAGRRVIEAPAMNISIRPFSGRVRWVFTHSIKSFDVTPAGARMMAARLMACADEAEGVAKP